MCLVHNATFARLYLLLLSVYIVAYPQRLYDWFTTYPVRFKTFCNAFNPVSLPLCLVLLFA